jgi:putative tryptophan/tyrosine transport system substrate-binding protein
MRRRDFIIGLSAMACPVVGRAQQISMPVVGILSYATFADTLEQRNAFTQGLAERGFIDRRNVMLKYRYADYAVDRLPALAAELVREQVAVIHPTGLIATLAAKAATQTIPIAFAMGGDPVQAGIVASLDHPGANLTGITSRGNELANKRLELLHEITPSATIYALLVNPANPISEVEIKETQTAAASSGARVVVISATLPDEFEMAFTKLAANKVSGLIVGVDTLFLAHAARIARLAAHYRIPAMFGYSRAVKRGGGLMSYATDLADAYRLAGVYAGRILAGEKPADIPVGLSTKIEFLVNLKTAKALGLTIPQTLLATADEVIQ